MTEVQKLTPAEYDKLSETERGSYDLKMREKETMEQESLPYRWKQTLVDVDVSVPVPAGLKSRQLDIGIMKKHLRVAIKGDDKPIIDVTDLFFLSFPRRVN